ncbi:hypothetical protein HPP92_028068 [Vanilla planifolia]|uniref:RRM domain-containing protein n=1 Tax=Vanilla planifolia TaxID=51239 RepID=A0A835U412_VANPL|nr:hypothetical protein HPP92_028068 [Vanilla planifolia]
MPSHIMDQRHPSSLFIPPAPSSFFSEEICVPSALPSERQPDFQNIETDPQRSGSDGLSSLPGSKSLSSSPLGKKQPVGGSSMKFFELPQTFLSKEQKAMTADGNHLLDAESTYNLSMASVGASHRDILPQSNFFMQHAAHAFHLENSLFSSSLSGAFGKKSSLLLNDVHFGKSIHATNSACMEDVPFESLKEIEAQTIGDLLPDDDDLLSGVIDEVESTVQNNSIDEDDLFYSGGGMELEGDENCNCKRTSSFVCEGVSNRYGSSNSTASGELLSRKHHSRTLIMRNVNSNIEDAELKKLFEQFGDIRALHTASKNRGYVMVSYYDIRAAMNAMRTLQDRFLGQRKFEIGYYLPMDNGLDKVINHSILSIFNLDSSVSIDDIHRIFGSYGVIKEIFHDPNNQNKKAVEFYDVRAAEAALRGLSMSEIAGKRIRIEPGFCGSGWQCLGKDSSPEVEHEGSSLCRNGSSLHSSSLEIGVSSGSVTYGASPTLVLDNESINTSAFQTLINPLMESRVAGIPSTLPNSMTLSSRTMIGGDRCSKSSLDELSCSLGQMSFGFQTFHPHSLPDFHDGLIGGIPFNTLTAIPPMGTNITSRNGDRGPSHINNHSFEHKEGKGFSPVNGHQYLLNNSTTSLHPSPGSLMWQNSPSFVNNIPGTTPLHGLPRGPSSFVPTCVPPPHHHHIGSAPAPNSSLWERSTTYAGDCIEAPPFHPGSLGNVGFSGSPRIQPHGTASHSLYSLTGRNFMDPSMFSMHIGSPLPQQRSHMLHGRNTIGSLPSGYDVPVERVRNRRSDGIACQTDNKKQFELDIDRIIRGRFRTTLMIKNIPNKYTSKMLLATIDEQHKGCYDFIYLPIDFKNKCNVGYAFINLTDPKHIIPFYQAFNGKKWEKFNSEKVASLAYARIQGKAALVAHFQNSSLMNEDKRCRPILFHSDGPNAGDQEPFPMGAHIRTRPGRSRSGVNEEHQQRSPSDSGNGDDLSNSTGSSSSSVKDSE